MAPRSPWLRSFCLLIALHARLPRAERPDGACLSQKPQQWLLKCKCSCWQGSDLWKSLTGIWGALSRNSGDLTTVGVSLHELFGDDDSLVAFGHQIMAVMTGNLPHPSEFPQGLNSRVVDADCPTGWALLSLFASIDLWLRFGMSEDGRLFSVLMFSCALEWAMRCASCLKGKRWPWKPHELLLNYGRWVFCSCSHLCQFELLRWQFPVRQRNPTLTPGLQRRHEARSFARDQCPAVAELNLDTNESSSWRRVAIACIAPAMWPWERDAMLEMANLYMSRCEWCGFFVANADTERPLPKTIGACYLIDLAQEPEVREDPVNETNDAYGSNLLPKLSHAIVWLSKQQWFSAPRSPHPSLIDWFCLMETDVYFVPENFRRLITLLGLVPERPEWVGHTVLQSLHMEGVMIEPAGSCLSLAALRKAGAFFEELLQSDRAGRADSALPKHPILKCNPFHETHMMKYTSMINSCMRLAKISLTDPRNVHDLQGREYFPLVTLDAMSRHYPPPSPGHCPWQLSLDEGDLNESYFHGAWSFKGKEYIYLPCQRAAASGTSRIKRGISGEDILHILPEALSPIKGRRAWIAEFPVMFHGHLYSSHTANRSNPIKQAHSRGWQVHEIMTRNSHGEQDPRSFPKVDWRFRTVQYYKLGSSYG